MRRRRAADRPDGRSPLLQALVQTKWSSSGGGSATHEDTRHRRRRVHRHAPGPRARRARRRGRRPRQPRGAGPRRRARPSFPTGVELIVGDVGDPRGRRRARSTGVDASSTSPPRSASASRCTRSRATPSSTRWRPRASSSASWRSARCPIRLVVASSMSIYGEGEYECAEHGRVAPGPRPEEQLLARQWEIACPHCGPSCSPVGTSEAKPLIPTSIYAITKRDHEELCLVTGAAYGIPTVALRFFNVYGPGQALSNPYTGVAAIFASRLLNGTPAAHLRGRRSSRATSSTSSDIVQGILLALESEDGRRPGDQPRHRPARRPSPRWPRCWPTDSAWTSSPSVAEQYRAGDIRHCFADPTRAGELLGFEAETSLRGRMAELWSGSRTRRPTTGSTTPPRSWPPAAWRASGPERDRTATDQPTSRSSSSRPTRRSGSSRACAPSSRTRATPRSTSSSSTTSRPTARASSSRPSSRGARVVDSANHGLRPRQQPRRR